jgi:hypothetical protein
MDLLKCITVVFMVVSNTSAFELAKVETKPEWKKIDHKFILSTEMYGSYNSFVDAKNACVDDANCGGVYDLQCDNKNTFKLYPKNAKPKKSGSGSCIYERPTESFTSLGCWKDNRARAIDGYEGTIGIQGCFERAKALGNNVFAVQYGGECYTTATAGETYNKYGVSNGCYASGTGGSWANEVYNIG